MSSSFEKSVKGATKIKLAPPKAKYVEHILVGTHSGEAGVAEVFRTLQNRLRDSTWTIVFKALIITHLMIKDGQKDVTLAYLAAAPRNRLALNSFTDGRHSNIKHGPPSREWAPGTYNEIQTQGANIRRYGDYLLCRTLTYADTKIDYCKTGAIERMKSLSVEKGLLRETGAIQDQIRALLKCDFFSKESENDIALTAFRLIVQDLLELYTAMNQAVMNVLSRYFELSHPDAERAVKLYKVFTKQTDQVVNFLSVARSYEKVTRLEIPTIKHAPTSLEKSLEEYLNDKDFETNRRQYLAAQQGRKGTKFEGRPFGTSSGQPESSQQASSKKVDAQPAQAASSQQAKGPAPDLIDFFDSIEQQQQPMAQQAPADAFAAQQAMATEYGQTNGIQPQQTGTNPFGQYMSPVAPLNTQFTGMGFGGYGPQPPQQFVQPNEQYEQVAPQQTGFQQMVTQHTGFQQQVPQQTGFQSQQSGFQQMAPQQTGQPFDQPQLISPQQTNPFRQSMAIAQSNFSPTSPQALRTVQAPQSTNPFARMSQVGVPANPPQQASQITGGFGQTQLQQFQQQQQQQQPASLMPQRTGTNPFARAQPQQTGLQQVPEVPQSLAPTATGSTNPFRQSMFVNQQTGRGWQTSQQGTMGGLEQLETVPVFPRPGQ